MTGKTKLTLGGIAALLALAAAALSMSPGQAAAGATELVVALDPPLPAGPLPGVTGPAGAPLIVIDAGHGGHDSGARSADGAQEKNLTLALAKALGDRLARGGRVRVALTRRDDRFLVLNERSEMARRLGAALLLSIHADSAGADDAAHGATLYTLSQVASDAQAAALAARENKADIVRGVNLSGRPDAVMSILIDLTRRESLEQASALARAIYAEAKDVLPFRRDYLRRADLMVLKAPDVPSLLLETGYITNAADRGLLASTDGQQRVAAAMARAVEKHLTAR